jgi:hypothetical protein
MLRACQLKLMNLSLVLDPARDLRWIPDLKQLDLSFQS